MTQVELWSGDLKLSDSQVIKDLHLSLSNDASHTRNVLPVESRLHLLAYVDPNRIPLHLAAGPSLKVDTGCDATQDWFSDVLLDESVLPAALKAARKNEKPWHESGLVQSRVGILVRVSVSEDDVTEEREMPPITELLFYALQTGKIARRGRQLITPPPSSPSQREKRSLPSELEIEKEDDEDGGSESQITLYALPLSSALLYKHSSLPKLPPNSAQFLPRHPTSVNSKKRPLEPSERLGTLFDEAADRRRKVRKQGLQSVAPSLSRTISGTKFAHARRTSNTSTIGSIHSQGPATAQTQKRGTLLNNLAHPPSCADSTDRPNTPGSGFGEHDSSARNKQAVSRTVMAGMRLRGLVQSKAAKPRHDMVEKHEDVIEQDAEYKGVYHATYKAVLFAFRRDVENGALLGAERIRGIVDRQLDLFCNEPP